MHSGKECIYGIMSNRFIFTCLGGRDSHGYLGKIIFESERTISSERSIAIHICTSRGLRIGK